MIKLKILFQTVVLSTLLAATAVAQTPYKTHHTTKQAKIIPGADQTELYLSYLKGKNIGMVVNQTSVIGKNLTPSVDSLLKLHVAVNIRPRAWFQG